MLFRQGRPLFILSRQASVLHSLTLSGKNVQLRQCRHAGKLNYCTSRIAGGHARSLNGVRQDRQTSERAVRCNTLALRTECCMMQVSCREGLGKNNPCSWNLKLHPQSPRGALISQRTVSTFRCQEPGDMQWYQSLFIEPFSVTAASCCFRQVCVVKEVSEHSERLCPSMLRIFSAQKVRAERILLDKARDKGSHELMTLRTQDAVLCRSVFII